MKYFTLDELMASATAERLGIDNHTDDPAIVASLTALIDNLLNPLREAFGMQIVVSSGYRSPRVNKAVGGVETSQHTTGQAADIRTTYGHRDQMKRLAWLASQFDFDQLILEQTDYHSHEPTWLHVSYKSAEDNRGQILANYRGQRGFKIVRKEEMKKWLGIS